MLYDYSYYFTSSHFSLVFCTFYPPSPYSLSILLCPLVSGNALHNSPSKYEKLEIQYEKFEYQIMLGSSLQE